MLHSPELMDNLPRLRRYARAITGSRGLGDELVISTMRRWEKTTVKTTGDALLDMFGLLAATCRLHVRNDMVRRGKSLHGVPAGEPGFAGLSLSQRQAFLLVALEQFDHKQAARILRLTPDEFETQLSAARREVSANFNARVLIIEDDGFVAADLVAIMSGMGHRVVGVARTRKEAIGLAQAGDPELILCDINLADGSSGIAAANDIMHRVRCKVVFITSHPERLLTGAREEPAFLIRKPYTVEQVGAISSQALFVQDEAGREFVDTAAAGIV